tara:strand:- start:5445 stop:6275 length:831 start_codon:yes stop_codon:yes gene_type:complete
LSIEMSDKKYNLVTFYSEGTPNDEGLNLSLNRDIIYNCAKNHVDDISFYTPLRLRKMGYDYFVKKYERQGLVNNLGFANTGFGAWKPLIILLELEKMKDGDILIYRDCNAEKYDELKNYNNIKNIAEMSLQRCHFDFFVSSEYARRRLNKIMYLKYYAKTNVLRELGENHPMLYSFPNLKVNLLFIRKTRISIDFLKEWKTACEKERWINGEQYGELCEGFQWHCPEQAILNTLIVNWIRNRKYNIPLKYPFFSFKRDLFPQTEGLRYFDYLKELN